LYLNC